MGCCLVGRRRFLPRGKGDLYRVGQSCYFEYMYSIEEECAMVALAMPTILVFNLGSLRVHLTRYGGCIYWISTLASRPADCYYLGEQCVLSTLTVKPIKHPRYPDISPTYAFDYRHFNKESTTSIELPLYSEATVEDGIVTADCDLGLCMPGKTRTFDFGRHYGILVQRTGVVEP